jgi:hypothetical protein
MLPVSNKCCERGRPVKAAARSLARIQMNVRVTSDRMSFFIGFHILLITGDYASAM